MIKEQDGDLVITKKDREESQEDVVNKENEEVKEEGAESLFITSASSEDEGDVESDEEEYIPKEADDIEISKEYEEEDIPNENSKDHVAEDITIVASSSYKEEIDEKKEEKIDNMAAIENAIKDAGLEDELSDKESDIIDKFISKTKVTKPVDKKEAERIVVTKKGPSVENLGHEEVQVEAIGLLEKFKDYVTSNKFNKKCETVAKKHGVKKDIVKNKVIAGFLGTVANVLGLSITLGGDILMSAVNFIGFIINKIIEFAVDNLKKLITLLTLNCGEMM